MNREKIYLSDSVMNAIIDESNPDVRELWFRVVNQDKSGTVIAADIDFWLFVADALAATAQSDHPNKETFATLHRGFCDSLGIISK